MSDLKQVTEQMHRAVKELRDTFESKSAHLADNKEKMEKIEKHLGEMEDSNQKLLAQIEQQKNLNEELEKKYNFLDASLSQMPAGVVKADEKKEVKEMMDALNRYAKSGMSGAKDQAELNQWQTKYLSTDQNVNGGFLVIPEFVREWIKALTEISLVRPYASVRQAASKTAEWPVRTALISSSWIGEGQTMTESKSSYGDRKIHIKKLAVKAVVTNELLQDAAFDMESEINGDVMEEFARAEGYAHVRGDEVNSPIGFMAASDVPAINSGSATDFDFDALYDLVANLKTGYLSNSRFGFNRFTLNFIRKLKATDGHYLWTPGNLAAGVPSTLIGHPYIELPDMDSIGADKYPIIFADFRRFYQIEDRLSLQMSRDYSGDLADQDKVAFRFVMRTGADVKQPEAGIKLKCAVNP